MQISPMIRCIDLREVNEEPIKTELLDVYQRKATLRHTILYQTDKPKCFELPDAGDTNPYHLFIYMLSRFYFVDTGTQQIPYYYPNRDRYLVETALSLLPKRFVRYTEKDPAVEYIELPSCIWYHDGVGEDWIYPYLRTLYTPLWSSVKEHGNRIFISRRSASLRSLQNESDLVDPLRLRGFSFYELERMTLEDQIKLIRSASVIVSPHGAGLTFLLFCHPGTKVCEISSNGRQHYEDISNQCGLRYSLFTICTSSEHETLSLEPSIFLHWLDMQLGS